MLRYYSEFDPISNLLDNAFNIIDNPQDCRWIKFPFKMLLKGI